MNDDWEHYQSLTPEERKQLGQKTGGQTTGAIMQEQGKATKEVIIQEAIALLRDNKSERDLAGIIAKRCERGLLTIEVFSRVQKINKSKT